MYQFLTGPRFRVSAIVGGFGVEEQVVERDLKGDRTDYDSRDM